MLLMSPPNSAPQSHIPTVDFDLVGEIKAMGNGPPECPICDVGYLELCQPNADDDSQLIGAGLTVAGWLWLSARALPRS